LDVRLSADALKLPFIDRFIPKIDQWLLVMSTQLIGFSISGICKRFLVTPPSMIWPTNLPIAALFNTSHAQETMGTHGHDGITRERFFIYVFIGFYSQLSLSVLVTFFFLRFASCQISFPPIFLPHFQLFMALLDRP
jgi:OPT oligopeptide transporter protein